MRSASSLLFFTLLIFLIDCVPSFRVFVARSSPSPSPYSRITLTVFDSRNSPSSSGLVDLPLLLRNSSFAFTFFWLLEVELSRSSSFCLAGEASLRGAVADSESLVPDADFPFYFLERLEVRMSFSADFLPEDLPAGYFLVI